VRLEGPLALETLESVINEIIRRHEVLRTRIEVDAGQPVQVIDEWAPRHLEVEDLTVLNREAREAEIRKTAREEVETGFDLSKEPLIRVKVLKLEEEEHVVFFTMHHIVTDGWSMGILIAEVGGLYHAFRNGKPSPLPELQIQYADYAVWQRERLQGELLDRQMGYWLRRLGGELPVFRMAIERPEPETRRRRAAHESVALSPELTKEIKALCRREGATLFMMLLAAFKALLYRYSGQEDLIVGTATANRNSFELEKLIGFFVNTLPLRTDLSGDPTFRELLARVSEVALGAYAHQETPFEKLVSELQPERSLNRTPLFRVFFALQNTPLSVVHLPELTLAPVEMGAGLTKMDLVLTMRDSASGLTGTMEYDTDLFDQATIKEATVHFQTLLENIVENPDQPISSLRLLSEIENEDQRQMALPEFQIGRQDFENILIQISSIPTIETK
jgi:hypothetical protein